MYIYNLDAIKWLQPLPSPRSHLFEVILPPLVTVGDVQGIQVLQGASVVSEGHLGYPLQDLVQLLLTLSLEKSKTQAAFGSSFFPPKLWQFGNIRVQVHKYLLFNEREVVIKSIINQFSDFNLLRPEGGSTALLLTSLPGPFLILFF